MHEVRTFQKVRVRGGEMLNFDPWYNSIIRAKTVICSVYRTVSLNVFEKATEFAEGISFAK